MIPTTTTITKTNNKPIKKINNKIEMNELKIKNYRVISLSADDDELVKRLSNRRACRECQTIFSLDEIKGKDKCPKCGAVFTVDEGLAEIQKKGF